MMITATGLPEYEERSKELGVLLFRQKPVDTKEIVKLVRTHYEKTWATRPRCNMPMASLPFRSPACPRSTSSSSNVSPARRLSCRSLPQWHRADLF